MDRLHYDEMLENLNKYERDGTLHGKEIYLFGHCNATETLADLLQDRGYIVLGILDNNNVKQGNNYKGILIMPPREILRGEQSGKIVCIVARAYEAMVQQLKHLGYKGQIKRLVDYNSFAEYSLSENTLIQKKQRLERGVSQLNHVREKYPGSFLVLCPFAALGDVFLTMSYLPHFFAIRNIEKCIVCVSGDGCKQVVELFCSEEWEKNPNGCVYQVEAYGQKELDELIQACIYAQDDSFYIAHQDRPYVVNLHRALHIKCIPLETIYKCGVFGLPQEMIPYRPTRWDDYFDLEKIIQRKTVIFSPYAKSVPTFDENFWQPIVADFREREYQCLTNVVGNEKPLDGTEGISPCIAQMKSVVERAGTFIGIRSGLCDVIRYAKCRKIALYPDYTYSDTKWKAIDMYALDGWENIVINEEFVWKKS